jgi:DNA-binding MarR family transcriptional regulator
MGDRGGTDEQAGAGPEAAGAAREPAAGAGVEAAGAMPAAAPGAPAAGSPAWLDEEEMPAWLAFLEVSHLLERAVEQQLKQDAGLSHAQYEILSRLESADGGAMRMSDLADVIIVSRSGLTYQVTQLERAGLVRRGKCPSDERGVLAAVTSAGRAALGRAAPGHVRVVRHFLIDALTAAQRSALRDGLAAARERLRAASRQLG